MKYFFIFIILFLILAVAGSVILIRQFDPDQFRPELERQLSQAIGAKAKLGPLSVRLGLELGLEIKGLELREASPANTLLLKTGNVTAVLPLKTLLERRLTVRSFRLERPEIYVSRTKDGRLNWETSSGISSSASAATPAFVVPPVPVPGLTRPSKSGDSGQKDVGKGEWQFLVSKVEVRDGILHFRDDSLNPPFLTKLDAFEILIRQESPTSSVKIAAHGNILDSPVPNLFLTAEYHASAERIDFKLGYDKDKVVLEGIATVAGAQPRFQGQLGVHQLDLEAVTPESFKRGEYLAGSLTAQLDGFFEGTHPELIKRSMTMSGSVDVRNGAFKNINFVHDVLSKLTPLPSLNQMLMSQLPPDLGAVINGKDTPFEILQANFQVQQGSAFAELIQMKHSHFLVDAGGNIGLLESAVDMKARLVLLEQLSAFLVQKVKEMEFLKNQQGRIVIPFFYRGVLPRASVQPDLGYVAGLVFRNQGQEIIATGLERLSELLGEKK